MVKDKENAHIVDMGMCVCVDGLVYLCTNGFRVSVKVFIYISFPPLGSQFLILNYNQHSQNSY